MSRRIPAPVTLRERMSARLLSSITERTPIERLMTREVTCARPDLTAAQVAALFVERHISALPVVDYEDYPVGIISKSDLVRGHGPGVGGHPLDEGSLAAGTVAELMTPALRSLRPSDSVATAARLMADEGLHHALVLDQEGRLSGIVSTFDFARWLAGPG